MTTHIEMVFCITKDSLHQE